MNKASKLNENRQTEFELLAKPLIKFLNQNYHVHTHIVITTNSAEVSEGVLAFGTDKYVRG